MDIPILKQVKRLHPDEPAVWDWQDENGASVMPVYEVLFAAMLPKRTPGAIVRFYEEAEFRRPKRIVPSGIEMYSDAGELLERLTVLRRAHNDTGRIFLRLTELERDFFYFFNREKKFYSRLQIMSPPNATDSGDITYHVNLVRELSRLHREKIYYPEGSEVPGILSALPEMPEKPITDLDYPAAAAVAYGLAAAYLRATVEPEASLLKKEKEYNPFSEDDPVMAWNPFADDDVVMRHDPFRNS